MADKTIDALALPIDQKILEAAVETILTDTLEKMLAMEEKAGARMIFRLRHEVDAAARSWRINIQAIQAWTTGMPYIIWGDEDLGNIAEDVEASA